jgi:endoglycosylceramidase
MRLLVSNLGPGRVLAAALTAAVIGVPAALPGHSGNGAAARQPGSTLVAAAAQSVPAGPIGHAGRWLTDSAGRVLLVTGVNMVYKVAPYAPDAAGFGADDAAFLAANGFTAVRVGVIWKAVEPQPGVFDDAYLARIAGTVATLASHGIVSLLDFHQDMWNESFQGEGAPDWAVQDNGLAHVPALGFAGNYFLQPALMAAYDNFWANKPGPQGIGLQDWYAGAWKHVAAYFKGNPGVLGYELMNEPSPGSAIYACLIPIFGCPFSDAYVTAFDKKVTAAIRQADPDTMVFSEPFLTFDVGYPSAVGATGDPHAGFSYHDYCPFPASVNVLCSPFNDWTFGNADSHSNSTGDALLLTEFGATSDQGVLSSVVADAESHRVGWMVWAYCNCYDPTTSASPASSESLVYNPSQPPTGSNVNQSMLTALAVPHPELVAGTPQSYHYDTSAHTFTLDYTTARADGSGSFPAGSRTTVAVPDLPYPSGYQVTVTGGRVVATGSVLELASCPGASEVKLTVAPGSGTSSGC